MSLLSYLISGLVKIYTYKVSRTAGYVESLFSEIQQTFINPANRPTPAARRRLRQNESPRVASTVATQAAIDLPEPVHTPILVRS